MGRYAGPTSKMTLDIDPKLKRRAALRALRRGITLSRLVEDALRLILSRKGGAK